MTSRCRAIPSYEPLVRNPLIFVVPAQAGTHIAFGNPVVWGEMSPRLRGDGEILTRRSASADRLYPNLRASR